jgi:beta-galactosidase
MFIQEVGKALLLGAKEQLPKLFPDKIVSYRDCGGEIAGMHIPESPVFDGLEQLDLAWFALGDDVVPRACQGVYRAQSNRKDTIRLAEVVDIHGYLHSPADYLKISGSPLIQLNEGKGTLIAS